MHRILQTDFVAGERTKSCTYFLLASFHANVNINKINKARDLPPTTAATTTTTRSVSLAHL